MGQLTNSRATTTSNIQSWTGSAWKCCKSVFTNVNWVNSEHLLITTDGYDVNVYKSARNIPRVSVSPAAELNALSLLKPARVLMTASAMDALRRRWASDAAPDAESSGPDSSETNAAD